MDGGPDAVVGGATADIAAHRGVPDEERRRGHNLARLAISALRNVQRIPRGLNGLGSPAREPLDCGNLFAIDGGGWDRARPEWRPIHVNGAGPALGDAAAIFRSRQSEFIAKHP